MGLKIDANSITGTPYTSTYMYSNPSVSAGAFEFISNIDPIKRVDLTSYGSVSNTVTDWNGSVPLINNQNSALNGSVGISYSDLYISEESDGDHIVLEKGKIKVWGTISSSFSCYVPITENDILGRGLVVEYDKDAGKLTATLYNSAGKLSGWHGSYYQISGSTDTVINNNTNVNGNLTINGRIYIEEL